MDVKVDNGDSCDAAFGDEGQRCDGEVVEHAIASPEIPMRVMGSAGELSGYAVFERGSRGRQRAAHDRRRSTPKAFARGKADPAHDAGRRRPVGYRCDIGSVMGDLDLGARRDRRVRQLAFGNDAVCEQPTPQHRIFDAREPVTRRQFEIDLIGAEYFQIGFVAGLFRRALILSISTNSENAMAK